MMEVYGPISLLIFIYGSNLLGILGLVFPRIFDDTMEVR